jgi:hypothetical protein
LTRTRPAAGCLDLPFRAAYSLDDAGEVALEDYARTLARAGAVELARAAGGGSAVSGVHVCGAQAALTPAVIGDVEDFARDLASGGGSGGLGWS